MNASESGAVYQSGNGADCGATWVSAVAPAPETPAGYRHPSVQVFVVTQGRTSHLEQTLKALRASRYPITSLVVVDADPTSDLTPSLLRP